MFYFALTSLLSVHSMHKCFTLHTIQCYFFRVTEYLNNKVTRLLQMFFYLKRGARNLYRFFENLPSVTVLHDIGIMNVPLSKSFMKHQTSKLMGIKVRSEQLSRPINSARIMLIR